MEVKPAAVTPKERHANNGTWFKKKPMPVAERVKGDLCLAGEYGPEMIVVAFNCEQLLIPDSGSMMASICNTFGEIYGEGPGSLKQELERKNATNESIPGEAVVYQVGERKWIGIVYIACTYGDCEGAMSTEISTQVRINWFEQALWNLGGQVMKLDPRPVSLGVSAEFEAGVVNKGRVYPLHGANLLYQKHMSKFAPQFPDLAVTIWERMQKTKLLSRIHRSNSYDEHEYDLCVVGAGPAGYRAAMHAATLLQQRVCIVDGCHKTQSADALLPDALGAPSGMPSKALCSVVIDHLLFKNLHDKTREARYTQCSQDWGTIMKNASKMLQKFDKFNKGDLFKAGVKLMAGWGSFVEKLNRDHRTRTTTLIVNREGTSVGTVGAEKFLVCTGATRMWPDGSKYKGRMTAKFPQGDKRFMTTDQVSLLDFLPKRLALIGTGITAMEFAAIFAKCGTEVTCTEIMQS